MRKVQSLLCSVTALVCAASAGHGVPNCDQVTASLCFPYTGCSRSINWRGDCSTHDRQYQCVWGGSPGCSTYHGGWQSCCCTGDQCASEGGCDCLLAGTPISLEDGTTKPVETMQVGDRVVSFDQSTGSMVTGIVRAIHAPYEVDHYFVINNQIKVTEAHPILSREKWVAVGVLRIGDTVTAAGGAPVAISSIQRVNEPAKVYNFQVSAQTYVAGGIIVHNKENCEDYIQYCPPCGQ